MLRRIRPILALVEQEARELSAVFYDAAWELCKRGIVRPDVRRTGDQAAEDSGYSLTAAGRAALANLDATTMLLAQPGSLTGTLPPIPDVLSYKNFIPLFDKHFRARLKA